jgi:hypothetical protein
MGRCLQGSEFTKTLSKMKIKNDSLTNDPFKRQASAVRAVVKLNFSLRIKFAQCLGEFAQCLVDFAQCLGEFSQCLVEFAQCLVEFAQCLGEFAQCLVDFAQCYEEFSQCLVDLVQCLVEFAQCLGEFAQCFKKFARGNNLCQRMVVNDLSNQLITTGAVLSLLTFNSSGSAYVAALQIFIFEIQNCN